MDYYNGYTPSSEIESSERCTSDFRAVLTLATKAPATCAATPIRLLRPIRRTIRCRIFGKDLLNMPCAVCVGAFKKIF